MFRKIIILFSGSIGFSRIQNYSSICLHFTAIRLYDFTITIIFMDKAGG